MTPQYTRPAAVAGTWYPAVPDTLTRELDRYCAHVSERLGGDLKALVAPHAGLVYSGPVAAHAYQQLDGRAYDVVVLVGPSHYASFEGVALWPRGAFETPLGPLAIADDVGAALLAAGPPVCELLAVHLREHSLEMQLPFLQRFLPHTPLVPLIMGRQDGGTIARLAAALVPVLQGRRALLVASSDLSHYHDAPTAARVDNVVLDAIRQFDPERLERALADWPDHACGGGPIAVVMRVARAIGAREARVLRYADSGDISGDKSAVVGYTAAAFGTFQAGSTDEVAAIE